MLFRSVVDLAKMRRVMRIGVDDDLYAVLLGLAKVGVVEVEAVGIGVQFHVYVALARAALKYLPAKNKKMLNSLLDSVDGWG